MTRAELISRFQNLFGRKGGDRLPGNMGSDRSIVGLCKRIWEEPDPLLHGYFEIWDSRGDNRKAYNIQQHLISVGQWEAAWAIAQLHYDQVLKAEAEHGKRFHKGHPLCNLALAAGGFQWASVMCHYAMLSSAGDVYWEHRIPELKEGGLAPTLIERFASAESHDEWRQEIRSDLASKEQSRPLYLEAYLCKRWFGHRLWSNHIAQYAAVTKPAIPFADVLLHKVEDAPTDCTDTARGTWLEAAIGLLLSSTPGFHVDSARRSSDEQIDLVVKYTPEPLTSLWLDQGCGLVECKSSTVPVSSGELRDFGTKCAFHRVRFGILISQTGTSGSTRVFAEPHHAELVRRRFLQDGLVILVLNFNAIRNKARKLRGLLDDLASDYNTLVFGEKG